MVKVAQLLDPDMCPFCFSGNIELGERYMDERALEMLTHLSCLDCGHNLPMTLDPKRRTHLIRGRTFGGWQWIPEIKVRWLRGVDMHWLCFYLNYSYR